jgi:hypothetical protein
MIVDSDKVAVVRAAHEIYSDSPGLTVRYPGVGSIDGVMNFDASLFPDFLRIGSTPAPDVSEIMLHITGQAVTGSLGSAAERYALQGTLNERGIVEGAFTIDKHQYTFSCRLPGSRTAFDADVLKDNGIWFIAYDERLNRLAIRATLKDG